METRNIKIDIQTAKDWYYSKYEILKELALKVFSAKELEYNFWSIRTFEDACKVLKLDCGSLKIYMETLSRGYSKASVAMFKLNIIRKALNLGQDLHLARDPKDSYTCYPYNPFVTMTSTHYRQELNSGKIEVIGKIRSEGKEYQVLGGSFVYGGNDGLGNFSSFLGVGAASANIGFLGCASKEIAQHFGKYFGMLITEAKYGDMVDFEVIDSKYPN
nr:MAG TPA: hypothetical protein [Caudoviricetes sp.]